jgi:hypothetical protein
MVNNIPSTPIAAPAQVAAKSRGSRWMVVATVAAAVGFGILKLGALAVHAHAWMNLVRLVTGQPH